MSTSTEAATALPLRQTALGDLDHELASTRRVLERVPDEHLGWKPHEKSWTLGALATHVGNLAFWCSTILGTDELDLAGTPPRDPAASREELLRAFDGAVETLRGAMGGATDEVLLGAWTLRKGDQVLMRQPRLAMIRTMAISHMVHHRAQVTVYLRMLDVPLPGLYGPSADEARP